MIKKQSIHELAILGGQPIFKSPVHVGGPNQVNSTRLLTRISDILDSNQLTNRGPFVQRLENDIAQLLGVKHCISMCNGTVALEIAERALGLKGEVIVPSFTFVATPHSLQWQEITPVFCDISPETHNIDPDKVEQLITPKTSAILGVHLWGRPCEIERLADIAQRHNLKLLFDASHAFSNSHGRTKIGNFGDAEIFSFHATKFVNCFEGGAVVTNNNELANRIRLMQNFGFEGLDTVNHIGINGKMNEISAAMGVTSLEMLDIFLNINKINYHLYRKLLDTIEGISLISYNPLEDCNYQYVALEIDETAFNLSRDMLVSILRKELIYARRYFYPGCHNMEPYKSYFPNSNLLLPETEKLSHKIMCLPTGTTVGQDDIIKIVSVIKFIQNNGKVLRKHLQDRTM